MLKKHLYPLFAMAYQVCAHPWQQALLPAEAWQRLQHVKATARHRALRSNSWQCSSYVMGNRALMWMPSHNTAAFSIQPLQRLPSCVDIHERNTAVISCMSFKLFK